MNINMKKININGQPFANTENLLAVIPPMMYSMLASPHETNIQEYTDGLRYAYHTEERFNVLYLPDVKRNLTNTHVTHPKHAAYIILHGPDLHRNRQIPGTDGYFNTNSIYCEDETTRRIVELYDPITHEVVHAELETLLHLAFEHRTMLFDEVCETFFTEDAPIYGAYFDKDAIQSALSWVFFYGAAYPEPVEHLANYVGVTLSKDVIKDSDAEPDADPASNPVNN